MAVYVRIEDGIVVEVIGPAQWEDGSDIPIDER